MVGNECPILIDKAVSTFTNKKLKDLKCFPRFEEVSAFNKKINTSQNRNH